MKSKNTFKKFITCMLIAAITITGISLESVTTANAATKYEQLTQDAVITMKVGERKRFLMSDENGKDLLFCRTWKVSNKNVIFLQTDFTDDYTKEYVELTANAEGTVTLTGRTEADASVDNYNCFWREHCDDDINITVKVVKPDAKMTAKQKKCKHTWKTLKKATCQRVGTKVCKKCKLQKTVKKTDHKWETNEVTVRATKDIICEFYSNYQLYDPDLYGQVEPERIIRMSDYVPADLLKHTRLVGESIEGPEGIEEYKKAFHAAVNEYMDSTSCFTYGFDMELSDEYITETVTRCTLCYKEK